MEPVKAHFKTPHQPDDDTSTNSKRQPQHIDDRIQLIPCKDTRSDPEVVPKHEFIFAGSMEITSSLHHPGILPPKSAKYLC
jgi:hypothetical protein